MRWKPPLVLVCLAAFGFGGALLVWGQGRPTVKAAPDGHAPAADEAPPSPPPGFDPPVKMARAAQPPQAPKSNPELNQLPPPAVTAAPPAPIQSPEPPSAREGQTPSVAPSRPNAGPLPLPADDVPPRLASPSPAPPASPLTPPPPPPSSPEPLVPLPPPAPVAPPPSPPHPWAFHVEVKSGRTHLQARMGNDARFTVVCDKLTLQAPDGSIETRGNVHVSAPDVEGTCDNLTISWKADRLLLEGKVRVKCRQDGQMVDVAGDSLSVRLTATKGDKAAEPIPAPSAVETE